jgi:hypothetical protein
MIAKPNISEELEILQAQLNLFGAMGKKKVGALEKVDADLSVLHSSSHIFESY